MLLRHVGIYIRVIDYILYDNAFFTFDCFFFTADVNW
jgi:hypothetical protein